MNQHDILKLEKECAEFLETHRTYEKVGEVFGCCDTANFQIITKFGKRFMVTCEFDELLKPTKPCFQTGMEKLVKNLKNE